MTYTPPKLQEPAFNCPHCRVFAKQEWFYMNCSAERNGSGLNRWDRRFQVSYCTGCGFQTIWLEGRIVYPDYLIAEEPNGDLPDE
jgi:hypothetical protein